jgi:hypothetical protein
VHADVPFRGPQCGWHGDIKHGASGQDEGNQEPVKASEMKNRLIDRRAGLVFLVHRSGFAKYICADASFFRGI